MAKHIVATIDEIPPGERKLVQIAGRSIGIFNINGEFFALRDRCPHQGGPLCQGTLSGLMESDGPGQYQYSRPDEILRCPWHGWEFDIRTGQSWFDPARTRVRRYDVYLESKDAEADETPDAGKPTEAPAASTAPAGRQKGPYLAETYPVSVEETYVVVEI